MSPVSASSRRCRPRNDVLRPTGKAIPNPPTSLHADRYRLFVKVSYDMTGVCRPSARCRKRESGPAADLIVGGGAHPSEDPHPWSKGYVPPRKVCRLDRVESPPGCPPPPVPPPWHMHGSACPSVSHVAWRDYARSRRPLELPISSSRAKKTRRPLFDEHLLYASNFAETEVPNRFLFARKDDESLLEIWTVGVDVGRVLCCLFDGVHFLLACLLVHGTYHDRLSQSDVSGRRHVRLRRLVFHTTGMWGSSTHLYTEEELNLVQRGRCREARHLVEGEPRLPPFYDAVGIS